MYVTDSNQHVEVSFIFNNELKHVGFFSVVSNYSYFHSNNKFI